MKHFVSWEEVCEYINFVNDFFKDRQISGVYGIPRGGLIFAVMLSHKMNIPMLAAPAHNCIIIDDIADSGRSLIHYTNNDTQFNKYFITTMFYHKRSLVIPDLIYQNKDDEWIVFPWEYE